MKIKIKDLSNKLIVLAMLIFAVLMALLFRLPCIWLFLTDIPCPGCGMTRALISAFKLDIKAAFSFHFMFWSIPLLLGYFFFDGKLFKQRLINKIVFIVIASGFFINWIIKLLKIFNL